MSTINEKSTELFKLLTPHRTTNVMQRIQVLSVQKTGKKLTEFIANGASEEDKIKFLDELIEIAKSGDWTKLPAAADGQTAATTPVPTLPPAAAPKPKPVAVVPVTPAEKPKPVLAALIAASEKIKPGEFDPAAEREAERQDREAADPVRVALLQLHDALIPRAKPAPALTEEQVRLIFRREFSLVLRTIADVIDAQTK